MQAALRRIQLGELSVKAAARAYNLPRSTLQDKYHGRTPVYCRQGPDPVLTSHEEDRLVSWAFEMSRVGFCQDKASLLNVCPTFSMLKLN